MTDLPSYLFGDILGISRTDLYLLGSLTVVAVIFYAVFRDAIISIACDGDFAQNAGAARQIYRRHAHGAGGTDHCGVSAHCGHRHGYFAAERAANDGDTVCQYLPPNGLAFGPIPPIFGLVCMRFAAFVLCRRAGRSPASSLSALSFMPLPAQ